MCGIAHCQMWHCPLSFLEGCVCARLLQHNSTYMWKWERSIARWNPRSCPIGKMFGSFLQFYAEGSMDNVAGLCNWLCILWMEDRLMIICTICSFWIFLKGTPPQAMVTYQVSWCFGRVLWSRTSKSTRACAKNMDTTINLCSMPYWLWMSKTFTV